MNENRLDKLQQQELEENNYYISTYLGERGYSIYKSALSIQEQQHIREELTVSPYVPGSPVKSDSFPVYRESENKMYIPRYYGIENYGVPDISRIKAGDDINIDFVGDLRDYQIDITNKFYQEATKDKDFGGGGLLDIHTGAGKTVMALKIISMLKKKTLIIVHKGFLVMQWEERIRQYLPNAKIGRIQAQTIDMKDKDIVIGMLQSLSMKEYPRGMFDSFGLTIVDEVHHISSEVFCRSLTKIVTKYTLGLSATMQRKDGLTKVFKMYLGDIIYKMKRSKEHEVLVRAIKYKVDDEEFNKVEYDFRGNAKFSTMISKVCDFNPRTEFILDVLKGERKRDPSQQIIILAHNKSLLTYLFKAIEHRNIATVGYYIGGMKETALKASETKEIIVATYAMAAEALDIKSLTTLVLASPKTDVVQAVGRILRQKGHQPVIIDIVDTHEPFQKQWEKRKVYYAKEGYRIIQTDNEKYKNDEWKEVFKAGKTKVPKIKDPKEPDPVGKCLIDLS